MIKADVEGNAIIPETKVKTELKAVSKPKGEFKIVVEKKRIVKTSASGAMIEALKRANGPLKLNALAARVSATNAGKALKVKDLKARVRRCADWYVKDESGYVAKDADGAYFLVRVNA